MRPPEALVVGWDVMTGELLHHGVVRTPLCALARRLPFRGVPRKVMNGFFATTADVYRLTGERETAHDPHLPADGGAKDLAATRRQLARRGGAGYGDFLVPELAARLGRPWRRFAAGVAALHPQGAPGLPRRVQVGAPSVAVVTLFHQEMQ